MARSGGRRPSSPEPKVPGSGMSTTTGIWIWAGSGVATLGVPGTPGITPAAAEDTVVARFNALGDVESAMERWPKQVAAVIVEPVAGNMGVVLPADGFLAGLRDVTRDSGSLLIFDEVITGFRIARGGAQELYGVTQISPAWARCWGAAFRSGRTVDGETSW